MTPRFLLIAALAVGFTLLHGSGAAPAEDKSPRRLTDEELAELDTKLEAVTPEQAAIFLERLKEHLIKWVLEKREEMRVAADKFVEHALAKLSQESTPEQVAALEKRMSDFTVEGAKESMDKIKLFMDKINCLKVEMKALFSNHH